MANAGRVAIVPKGEYNSATAYKRLDLVRYNNAVYVAKKANTGVSPTNTDTWMLCIQNVTQEQYDDLISGAVQVESAKEADNALKLNGLIADEFVTNEDLLINSFFKDPVNTSGKTKWTNAGTAIDKWVFSGNTALNGDYMTLTDDGVYMVLDDSSTVSYLQIYQYLSKLEVGKKYTLSVYVNGNVYTAAITGGTAIPNGVRLGVVTIFYTLSTDVDQFYIRLYKTNAASCTINWAKLEPGSVATPFIPPNKEVEKLKCGVIDIATHTATDLNTEFDSGFSVCKYNSSTLNTPYADGLTGGFVEGLCLTFGYSAVYGEQLAISGGGNYFLKREIDNGVFGAWGNVNDGGNADTLDGLHAGAFMEREGTRVNKLGFTTENGLQIKIDGTVYKIPYGIEKSDVAQKTDLANYFPLTGGTLSGNLTIDRNNPKLSLNNDVGDIAGVYLQEDGNTIWEVNKNDGTSCTLTMSPSRGVGAMTRIYENGTGHTVLHTGNSKKVASGTTAPSDTTSLWYDTTNKILKRYVDGAWQA